MGSIVLVILHEDRYSKCSQLLCYLFGFFLDGFCQGTKPLSARTIRVFNQRLWFQQELVRKAAGTARATRKSTYLNRSLLPSFFGLFVNMEDQQITWSHLCLLKNQARLNIWYKSLCSSLGHGGTQAVTPNQGVISSRLMCRRSWSLEVFARIVNNEEGETNNLVLGTMHTLHFVDLSLIIRTLICT